MGVLVRLTTDGGRLLGNASSHLAQILESVTELRSAGRIRSSLATACGGFLFACLLACPRPTGAQTFVEFAGGWNYVGPAPTPGSESYTHGFNVRASIGRPISSRLLLRLDAFTSRFDETTTTYTYPPGPCAFGVACTPIPSYVVQSQGVAGLTANGLVNVDPRGMFYLVGGAGVYDTYGGPARWNLGASAGAGISVPINTRLHLVVEARFHQLLGATYGPLRVLPITVGLRY
jgi:hypothetical protein